MQKALSLVAVAAGIALFVAGYRRGHSIVGHADSAFSDLGAKFDSNPHATRQARFYVAGALLVAGGLVGYGVARD
jgi:hypothetical protein